MKTKQVLESSKSSKYGNLILSFYDYDNSYIICSNIRLKVA